MWFFGSKKASSSSSSFSWSSTAEEVTHGVNGTGLTAIVTGASSGMGAEVTRVLALRGVEVIMADINIVAGNLIRAKILDEIPSANLHLMELDLSSMASVKNFASNYKSSHLFLNILINNAGVLSPPFILSKDNIEMHFATNYLGHFLLTHLLLDTMKNTALQSGKEGRIVNVTSSAHKYTPREGISFDKLRNPSGYSKYSRFSAYCQSKLAIILHANELAKQLKNDGIEIIANSVDPGFVKNTNIIKLNIFLDALGIILKPYIKELPQGAATTCYVALNPEVKGISGKYFSNSNLAKPSKQTQDVVLAQKLWDYTMDLITNHAH
ncbi:short-chain dehydrogenase TIC 32, chloroplastic-like [Amaranthus tricolor]|uniref:short-chain dehydrogenase TIC 32, chloroplastic-like n=1 Tax=Amaranthus tricolor TaxID=29722 RepID=UPI00258BFE33|nr:short-chain dehydrogenase TIC 32, chloroplastic-like [Amaranthus tricolor]